MSLIAVKHQSGKTHVTEASGSSEDGSLFGFRCCCGVFVGKTDVWTEMGRLSRNEPDLCKTCIKVLIADKRITP